MENSDIDLFVKLASEIIAELETAIKEHGPDPSDYPNAEIALKNVRRWRELAVNGKLPGSYYPNFGIGRSDLLFGKVEERMYELEDLYVNKIMDESLF
jgi:hypothetical protein